MKLFPKVVPHASDLGEIIIKVGASFQDHIVTRTSQDEKEGTHCEVHCCRPGFHVAISVPSSELLCIPDTEL